VQHTSMPGIEQCQVGDVELIPVAAPQHTLARNPPERLSNGNHGSIRPPV
jgi:hypothetical protein